MCDVATQTGPGGKLWGPFLVGGRIMEIRKEIKQINCYAGEELS